MPVTQLIYVSALAANQEPSCLRNILKESISHNQAHDITGILLYINGSFLQVLEGAPEAVGQLYEMISRDPRHGQAVKVLETHAVNRQFGEWSMGTAKVNGAELDNIIGTNDFFTSGHCFTELEAGIIKMVLEQFREGQWRRRIESAVAV